MSAKSVSQASHFFRTSKNGTDRGNACLGVAFLAALGVLALVFAGVVLYMALPQPVYEPMGSIENYPASAEPHDLRARGGFYLVNTGSEILALNTQAPRKAGCRIYWDAERGRFQDPCFGTIFDLTGAYVNGPPSAALGRYPVRIEDQMIWVSTQ